MSRCLYCNQPITDNQTQGEWHLTCAKTFFNSSELPSLHIDANQLLEFAEANIKQGYTIPGVQKKLSLHLSDNQGKGQLTIRDYPFGFIMKLPTQEYPLLPEYEHLTMTLAEIAEIQTVPHALYRLEDGTLAYLTKRIDRIKDNKIPMEDFAQLGGRLTEDKYRSSYEQLGKIVRQYSTRLLDTVNLWYLLVFSFVTGNSDMHLKNFSLYAPDGETYVLTPAYDLLPTNLIIPEDPEETALPISGKKNKIKRKDFLNLADLYKIQPKTALGLIDQLSSLETTFNNAIEESFLPQENQDSLKALIHERLNRLR